MKQIKANVWLRCLCIPLLVFSITLIAGCGGCSDDDAQTVAEKKSEDEKKRKKEKKKPDLESLRPVLLPAQYPQPKTAEEEEKQEIESEEPDKQALEKQRRIGQELRDYNRAKLGHWVSSSYLVRANNFNADGYLKTTSLTSVQLPVPISSTDYFISTRRPISLPKGEWKNLETSVYLPRREGNISNANVRFELQRGNSGLAFLDEAHPTALMRPHQYHIVVLSNRSQGFNFLRLMDFVGIPESGSAGVNFPKSYYVIMSRDGSPIPLPREALNWTTIAYIIWDDTDPDSLDSDQQKALLDWIHFGGQLIINSPNSLDLLETSFLADYLPAENESAGNLTSKDFAEFNENWAVPVEVNDAEFRGVVIDDKTPVLGVNFAVHPDAQYVKGTGKLVVERRVGRGRVVATSFSINSPTIRKWRSFPSFFNGVLLRRPAREFGETAYTNISFGWKNDNASIFDPLLGSTLRYLSRDLSASGETSEKHKNNVDDTQQDFDPRWGRMGTTSIHQEFRMGSLAFKRATEEDGWHYGGYDDSKKSGVAGWNDQSAISNAARETLKEAAGISPPSSKFVLRMLAIYLAVLVPLNWVVFRVMGRVEWAWIAAPLIAIAGAFTVVKMASLDIGFVRSNSQIGMLELYEDYSRGHLTEYSALYTSLTTSYDVDLDNNSSQSLPFSIENKGFKKAGLRQGLTEVQMNRTRLNRLENLLIQSNTTGLVHSEAMLDVDGPVRLLTDEDGVATIENESSLSIKNAGIVSRTEKGDYQVAWIGDLESGASSKISYTESQKDNLPDQWTKLPTFSSNQRLARRMWTDNVPTDASGEGLASLDEILKFPEIKSAEKIELELRSQFAERFEENDSLARFSLFEFQQVFRSVNAESNVSVGPMFDAVVGKLELRPGQARLIGVTNKKIGVKTFSPKATQVDQQTLVVCHLGMGQLPIARRDVNAYADVSEKVRSSLDWEDETDGLDIGPDDDFDDFEQ